MHPSSSVRRQDAGCTRIRLGWLRRQAMTPQRGNAMAATVPPGLTRDPESPPVEEPPALRAVHTANFPTLLRQLGASLLVTTYQAGKLVMVRDEGDHLNAHFRAFPAPMGLALD